LLIGFSLFYGLEKWIGKPSPHEDEEASRLSIHFRVHTVGLSLYKILLGYLLGQMGI
jgi:hypothetical protein